MFDPERDRDLAYRFGQDIGVAFMNYLAFAVWPLGEIARAQQLQVHAGLCGCLSRHVRNDAAGRGCRRAVCG
jgi:hypothetical protein